jgi:hypothetical protein
VVLGGIGTILVTLVWAWRFPQLRKVDQLLDTRVEELGVEDSGVEDTRIETNS